jgi:hypothetical protein
MFAERFLWSIEKIFGFNNHDFKESISQIINYTIGLLFYTYWTLKCRTKLH